MAEILEQRELRVESAASRLSWGGIIAGSVATLGIGFLLLSLGTAIGFIGSGLSVVWMGIYTFLSIVAATFCGAFIGSQFTNLSHRRQGLAQGVIIWALSLSMGVGFGIWTAGMAAKGGLSIAGAALQTAGQVTAAVPGAGQMLSPDQQNQVKNQVAQGMQNLPGSNQIQEQLATIGQSAQNIGAAFFWWFFATAACALLAALYGGPLGVKKHYEEELPSRREVGREVRRHTYRPTETRA